MTKSSNFDSANSTVNKEKMAETYSKVVQNGINNDMSVKPIFLLESDMFGPKPSDKDFLLHHELYKIIGQLIPSSHLRALQRVRGMWRVYTQGEDDRSKLLISGIVEMPNEQSQETLARDLKKTQNKNSQKLPIQQSQPPFQSITNVENDEGTGEAAASSSKKAKKNLVKRS
ncbi:unnamed protein product [Mytilus edulis]|uniref:Uncharacterized protein n=1 Tax=Mytilus edulis TaxID=6550 RepID=A0A8S3TS24_MYTED|nr:unnamed protein product [Mytilus edulis]